MSIELTQVDDADLSDADSDVHNPVTVFHNESAGVLTRFKELLDRRPYLCRYFDCEERFENIETRTIHGNTHFCSRNHPFTHSKCPTSFISTEDFTYHERYEHKRSIIGWRCNLCLPSENIQRRYGLEEHLQMFHPERCADPTRDVLLRGGRARKLCSWLLIFRDGSEKEKSVISGSLSERERRTVHLLARQLGLWPLSRKTDEGLEIIVNRFASNSTVFEPIYKDALAQGPVSFPSRSITPTIPTTTLIPDRKRKRLVGGSPTFTAEGSGLRVTFKKSKKVGRPTIPWSVASKRLLVRFVTLSHCKPELLESALKENGFSAGIRHIQTKVRNMFGPMKPHDPGYDRELRPNNSDEMNFRVRALLDCKEQWYMLKHRLNLPKKMDRLEIDDPGSEIPPLLGNSDIWDSLCLAPELDEYVTTDSMEVAQAIGFEEGNNLSSNLYDRRMTDFEGHVDCDRNDINPLDDATQLLVAGKYSRSAHEHTTCPRDVRALPIQSATSTKSQAGFDHMPLGTTPAHSTTRPVSKKPLTMEDRRQICLYHMKWPSAKQVEIAGQFRLRQDIYTDELKMIFR